MPGGKGKGKTRGGGAGTSSKDALSSSHSQGTSQRPSRSRNTTPASTTISEQTLMSGDLGLSPKISYGEILDKYVNQGAAEASIPTSSTLASLASDLKALSSSASKRAEICQARMAELSERVTRKKEEELERMEKEAEEREREKQDKKKREREEREREKKARDLDHRDRKKKDRDRSGKEDREHTDGKRPHTHGAHKMTSQAPDVPIKDEYGNTTKQKRRRKPDLSDDSVDVKRPRSISHSPPKSVSSESDSDRQPTPIPPAIVFDHFENDDTIYQIEDVTDETSIEDRCRIYSVAAFPTTDLTELQPGDPPDEDFSKAKPANQVMHATFSSYIEPYFRNFTEEDLAFLRERGDRVAPYTIPPLGQHYSEVWASDDAPVFASPAPPQLHSIGSKGAPDMLTDDMLEKEEISLGPLMSRILAGMIFEENVGEGGGGSEGANGSSSNMTNGDTPNHISGGSSSTLPGWQDAAFKTNLPKTDYTTLESRLKQEMRFIGLIGPNEDEPDWKAVEDDEISARLRALQGELRKQSILNGARKARLQHLLKEQLAWQEYATILDDLDKQVEQAYTKRTRNIKAKKKKVVPNGAGIAQAKLGIGDLARTLMDRRGKWRNLIGPVFDEQVVSRIPKESIFADMEELERVEEMGGGEEEG